MMGTELDFFNFLKKNFPNTNADKVNKMVIDDFKDFRRAKSRRDGWMDVGKPMVNYDLLPIISLSAARDQADKRNDTKEMGVGVSPGFDQHPEALPLTINENKVKGQMKVNGGKFVQVIGDLEPSLEHEILPPSPVCEEAEPSEPSEICDESESGAEIENCEDDELEDEDMFPTERGEDVVIIEDTPEDPKPTNVKDRMKFFEAMSTAKPKTCRTGQAQPPLNSEHWELSISKAPKNLKRNFTQIEVNTPQVRKNLFGKEVKDFKAKESFLSCEDGEIPEKEASSSSGQPKQEPPKKKNFAPPKALMQALQLKEKQKVDRPGRPPLAETKPQFSPCGNFQVPAFPTQRPPKFKDLVPISNKNPAHNYDMSPKVDTDDENSDEERAMRKKKPKPQWYQSWQKMCFAQANINPDTVFGVVMPEPVLEKMFGKHMKPRRSSGINWEKDKLRRSECLAYAKMMGQEKALKQVWKPTPKASPRV